jgi:hypothetical protein
MNNHISNLKDGTQADNNRNSHFHRNGHLLGTTYVNNKNTREKRWLSQTKVKGKPIYLGHYYTQKEAHQAYLDFYKSLNTQTKGKQK